MEYTPESLTQDKSRKKSTTSDISAYVKKSNMKGISSPRTKSQQSKPTDDKKSKKRRATFDEDNTAFAAKARRVRQKKSTEEEYIVSVRCEPVEKTTDCTPLSQQTATGFKCHICVKEFKWERLYTSHMQAMHSSIKLQSFSQ